MKFKYTKGSEAKFIESDRLKQIAACEAAGWVLESEDSPPSHTEVALDTEFNTGEEISLPLEE